MNLYGESDPLQNGAAVSGLPLIGLLGNLMGGTPPQLGTPVTPANGLAPAGITPTAVSQPGGSPVVSQPGFAPPQGLPNGLAPLTPPAPPLGIGPANLGEAYPGLGWQQAALPGTTMAPPGVPKAGPQANASAAAAQSANAPGGAASQSSIAPALAAGTQVGLSQGGYGSGPGQILAPQQWQGQMAADEAKYGLPAGYLGRTARIESAFNPLANNGTAKGLMQFTASSAKQWGLSDPMDPVASIDAAARYAQASQKGLTAALGRPATGSELYLAHQQGLGGATALLQNPDMNAVDALKTLPLYQKNPATALKAITANGGNAGMTAGQFAQLWDSKFNTMKLSPSGGPAAAGTSGAGGASPSYGPGVHPALAAAHSAGDPLLAMAMLQALAPNHQVQAVSYDPFKVAPPPEPWQPVPLGG